MNKSSFESLTEEDKILTILRYFLSIISLFPRVYFHLSIQIGYSISLQSHCWWNLCLLCYVKWKSCFLHSWRTIQSSKYNTLLNRRWTTTLSYSRKNKTKVSIIIDKIEWIEHYLLVVVFIKYQIVFCISNIFQQMKLYYWNEWTNINSMISLFLLFILLIYYMEKKRFN